MDGITSALIAARQPLATTDRAVCRCPDHDLTLVIPAFNEAQRLPQTLAVLKETLTTWRLDYRVVVVDDGSSDGTARLPARYGSRFRAQRLPRHRGKGAAVRAGMLQATGAVAAFTDADLPFDLSALRHGYQLICEQTADVVCGARDLVGSGSKVSRSLWRHCASWAFRSAVQRLLALQITDTQCGLKVFSRRAIDSIFPRQQVDGLAFDVEVLYLAERLGLTCARIPVLQLNEYASTISLRRQALPIFIELLRIRWRGIREVTSRGPSRASSQPPTLPHFETAPSPTNLDRGAA